MNKIILFIICLFLLIFVVHAIEQLTDEELELHAIESREYFEKRKFTMELDRMSFFDEDEAGVGSAQGLDFSTGFGLSTLQCLHNNGFQFAIPRCYCSPGYVDGNCASNVANARAAGFQYVDAYMFPCPTCGNAASQFNTLWNYFINHKVNIGMVWLDIEGSQYWKDVNYNISFFRDLLTAASNQGAKIGIYSSKYMWGTIFGNWSLPGANNYPMWYAHYDNMAACSDWSSFGGFSRPALKQFLGDVTRCGGGVDINTYC